MVAPHFVIDTPDGESEFTSNAAAATFLLESGYANAQREPHWHMRWCLERMESGDDMDVGVAWFLCERGG